MYSGVRPHGRVNLGALKEKVGNKIAFMGGMDSSRAHLFWDTAGSGDGCPKMH